MYGKTTEKVGKTRLGDTRIPRAVGNELGGILF